MKALLCLALVTILTTPALACERSEGEGHGDQAHKKAAVTEPAATETTQEMAEAPEAEMDEAAADMEAEETADE